MADRANRPHAGAIRRLLIANRGEIAARIIRTCRALGIESVLAASEADRDSVPARRADRTVCIGPAHPSESYLRVQTIVAAALGTGAQAVHPGYGFLSENAKLARACEEAGVIFIGPTSGQLESTGDKLAARRYAEAAGVPVAPGGAVRDADDARCLASQIGYPLLVKAVGGGGGRGMKRVDSPAGLEDGIALAAAEAGAAFGDARLYLERFVAHGRHVEVQLLGDGVRVIHLGERDCSIQRRYQKLIEEAPAPGLAQPLRARMHEAACRFGARLGYRGLGTVEFLLDVARGEFFFLEMNARIQVEHPVTEAVTGLDLVAEQIAVAEGRGLRLAQKDVTIAGHAIECRINAEDPARDFRPAPGRVTTAEFPEGAGLRVDTHIEPGAIVPPFYDSLVAKLIAHGADRSQALARLRSALARTRLGGVATNVEMHCAVLESAEFAAGGVDAGFLPRFLERHFHAASAA
jgi:acetyl-CoA carboxylase biotin carboxylase subunit